MTFSIIIPVYNVAPYLRECMNSIAVAIEQCKSKSVEWRVEDIEVVCVDDGSTDGSAAILDEYAERFERCERFEKFETCERFVNLKVIHQANAGVSAARNAALEIAQGEWVGFLDGDDTLSPDLLEKVAGMIDANPEVDAVGFGMVFVGPKGETIGRFGGEEIPSETIIEGDEILREVVGAYSRFSWSSCDKFYRRSKIDEFGQRFEVGMTHQEDTLWAHRFLAQCGKVALMPGVDGYRYLMREGSAIHKEPPFPPVHVVRVTKELYKLWKKTKKPGAFRRARHFLAALPSVGKGDGSDYRARCIDWMVNDKIIDIHLVLAMLICGTAKARVFALIYAVSPKAIKKVILSRL